MKLSIETRSSDHRVLDLMLRGEIDYESAQDLRATITSALDGRVDRLVVSLAGVTFLDSTGIGTLVVGRRICREVGVDLQVRDCNPFIARLFAVVGVADVLGVPVPAGAVASRLPRSREKTPTPAA